MFWYSALSGSNSTRFYFKHKRQRFTYIHCEGINKWHTNWHTHCKEDPILLSKPNDLVHLAVLLNTCTFFNHYVYFLYSKQIYHYVFEYIRARYTMYKMIRDTMKGTLNSKRDEFTSFYLANYLVQLNLFLSNIILII
jgi:hypothetical protein